MFLLLVFFLAILFSLGLTIVFRVSDGILLEYPAEQVSVLSDYVAGAYINFKSLLVGLVYVFFSFLTFLTFISTFFSRTRLVGYLVSVLSGLLLAPFVLYISAIFWNTYSLYGITLHEFVYVFAQNFHLIIFVNLLAGFLSVIFLVRRSDVI